MWDPHPIDWGHRTEKKREEESRVPTFILLPLDWMCCHPSPVVMGCASLQLLWLGALPQLWEK